MFWSFSHVSNFIAKKAPPSPVNSRETKRLLNYVNSIMET